MRCRAIIIVTALLSVGCGDRQLSGSETDAVDMEAPLPDPEWSPCAVKDEAETCAQVCELSGMDCVENACPAEPNFCDPEPCDQATQVLGLSEALVCSDPPMGGWVASSCDAPIEWLSSNLVRCCCVEPS